MLNKVEQSLFFAIFITFFELVVGGVTFDVLKMRDGLFESAQGVGGCDLA